MQRTKIGYLTHTWNPIAMQCTPVSEGCKNCWSIAMNKRFKNKPEKPELVIKELDAPLRLKKPAIIGVQFMGDLFHPDISFNLIDNIFEVMCKCEQHTFLLLTKRIDRMKKYFEYISECDAQMGEPTWDDMPNPNIWLGTTIESNDNLYRADTLLQISAAKRFISFEPLLENIDYLERHKLRLNAYYARKEIMPLINHVFIGCESGIKKRNCELKWVEKLVEQFKAIGSSIFVKQIEINGKVEHDMSKFPKELQYQEFPK